MADRQRQTRRPTVALNPPTLAVERGFGVGTSPAAHPGAGHSIGRVSVFPPPQIQVGPVGDSFEQEADAVADHITRKDDTRGPSQMPSGAAPSPVVSADAALASGTAGGGQALASGDRTFFEEALGHDLGGVRVHSDGAASRSARDLSALAFTHGPDVVFREGQYRPGSPDGRRLLAHELTHVVQQGAAPASGPGGAGLSHSGPGRVQRTPDLMPDLPPESLPELPPGGFDFPPIPGETPFSFAPGTAAGSDAAATAAATDATATATTAAVTTDAAATTATAGGLEAGGGVAAGLGAEAILPVAAAGAAGVGAGMLLDAGVNKLGQAVTGDDKGDYSISNGIAHAMTAADEGLTSLWADPSKPAYTQTLGWKLANWLTPTSSADPAPPPAVLPGQNPTPVPAVDPSQTPTPAIDPGADSSPVTAPGQIGPGPMSATPKVDYDPDAEDDDDTAQRGEKGKSFRGGKKGDRDNWYGYDDPDFQNWWHRQGKQGNDIQNADEARDAYNQWVSEGSPRPK